jgi:hypothetical protein
MRTETEYTRTFVDADWLSLATTKTGLVNRLKRQPAADPRSKENVEVRAVGCPFGPAAW